MTEVFKTEFRGYNKQEVIDYVSKLNETITAKDSEIDSLKLELSRVKEPETVPADTEALEAEIYEKAKTELRAEIEAEFEKKRSEESGVYVLREELEALKEKAQTHDEQKQMIADLMIKARTDASAVYEQSQKDCRKIMEDTAEKLEQFENDYQAMRKNVLDSKSEMDARLTTIRHYIDDFSQYLEAASQDITNTVQNFKDNM